ncbi:MarR family winged helix-turn-helix transcriptional regulator [Nocardioides marmoribigeumensis]|uniref:DNA-binding MarR family transcriptional regulator n=1 Tax=Nocardioides marmoribigeumensis TaxID=433649 RepID=A0ABU2BZT6_9ACTN|nr:MarR family transcriptional regulator [Nocardioides marmoribigeumensis]MDR7363879.1 DNA-binding MarR family transcriptional regulator [Nocardioides marmoribigeumensis]
METLVDVVNQFADRVEELSNELVVLSARLVREVRRRHRDDAPAAIRVMSLVDELGPSTVSVLAEADRCSQPTMTGLVNGLGDKGWLERLPHPDDARSSLVSMTTRGRAALDDVRRRNAAMVAERVTAAGRTPEELATAVAVLSDVLTPAPQ